jgi:hypothetical protein
MGVRKACLRGMHQAHLICPFSFTVHRAVSQFHKLRTTSKSYMHNPILHAFPGTVSIS